MSVSRHCRLGVSLFRTTTGANHCTPFLSSTAPFRACNSVLSLLFPSQRSSSDAATISDTHDATPIPPSLPERQPHPWPEWVSFVDGLKSRGYVAVDVADRNVYVDFDQLKNPCLRFARDRCDVFKSLSMPDIQTLVEVGCPHIFREAVSSGKRLRAYLRMDEAEVCSKCNLRDSCDRAYVILKDNEADPRTVDIVRILLLHALDPLVFSVEKPPGRDLVEDSVRKLLSELVELSQKVDDPSLAKPSVKVTSQKGRHNKLSKDVEIKKGDWTCPKCNFMNFAKNLQCLKCKEECPKKVADDDVVLKKGDWICSECNFMNFAKNLQCLKCKEECPKKVADDDVVLKKGDWICSECGFMNFATKRVCLRCREARPKRQLMPGEWECPSCDFLNFNRNTVCQRCCDERPKLAVSELDEQV